MTFQKHPSETLVNLFKEKPYQGQSPEIAKVIFLSLDANYSEEITNHHFFQYILEYQKNGVSFWQKYGVHHPFILNEYPFKRNADGVPFHKRFSKLGLTKEYAENISFLELLNVPTIGKSSNQNAQFNDLVEITHLKYIDKIIASDRSKLILVSHKTLDRMQQYKKLYDVFAWLDYVQVTDKDYSVQLNTNRLVKIYHFSAWQIHAQIPYIRKLIDDWLT